MYDLKDTTAIEDSTPSTMDNQTFAVENLLKQNTAFPDYSTLEEDYFVLDGTMPEMPDDPTDIPFWTSNLSDENGEFPENPVLTILFTENHTSAGLTFHFVGDYPLLMKIKWYNLGGDMIAMKSFEPNNRDFFAQNLVEDFGRIDIEFIKTNPYRYVKLYGLEYGLTLIWDENNIKTATLVEETDPISNTLKANKLTFQFLDIDSEFDLGNEKGLHKALQKNQYMEPFEIVNGTEYPLGKYFLTSPSITKRLAKMEATDYVGILDNTDFTDGRVYNGDLAGTVLEEIFAETGIPYEVEDEIAQVPLYGWLKIQSRRKALREVLFACGAAVETTREGTLRIFKPGRKIKSSITRGRKFSTTVKQEEYVSDVNVKYTAYVLDSEEKEILKTAIYPAGNNTVQFNTPVSGLRISTGNIVEAKTNYLTFHLDEASELTVYGKQYTAQNATVLSSVEKIEAGEQRNSKSFTSTLCDYKQAKVIADSILDYYQLTLDLEARYLSENEIPCEWAEIDNPDSNFGNYVAGIESITTELTGGYIAKAKLRGYYKQINDEYYTGMELYADESVGVL